MWGKILCVFFLSSFYLEAKPVRGHVDMQVHLTTHMLYSALVGKTSPLDPLPKKEMSYKHKFKQAAYQEQLWEASTSLFVVTALDEFFHPSRKGMEEALLKQLEFIKEIVRRYPHRYGIAMTPDEAREIIHSGRKAFVLALEGGTKLVHSQEDAYRLREKGIAMVGIIHLKDNEYGSASTPKGIQTLLNIKAVFKRIFRCRHKGLTSKGKRAMLYLRNAGILTDLSHMDDDSINDALDLAEKYHFPVVATHIHLKSVTGKKTDYSDSMIRRIYQTGGMIGITSGNPQKAHKKFKGRIPHNYCPGSYQDLGLQSEHLLSLLKGNPSIGFATDMNGMVDHFRPKYGRRGCFERKAKIGDFFLKESRSFDAFDMKGLNHIGAVKGIWKNLERDSFSTENFMTSAEKFLQIWERVRG